MGKRPYAPPKLRPITDPSELARVAALFKRASAMKKRIDEMFAFVAEDTDGEGVCSFHTPEGWMPLVGADVGRVDSIRHIAQAIADRSGRTIRVLRFSVREELELIEPRKRGPA